MIVTHSLYSYCFVVSFEIGNCESSNCVFLLQEFCVRVGHLNFHMNFRISLSISVKKMAGILMGLFHFISNYGTVIKKRNNIYLE